MSQGISMEHSISITPGKRKRVLLTVESKLRIIERLDKGESFKKLAKEYNIGKTTIRDIYSKKKEYLNFALHSDSYNSVYKRKTLKKSMNHKLDMAVFNWFKEKRAAGETMTKAMLAETAQRLHKELGFTEPFAASDGWINGFKGRHGIENLNVPGEKMVDVASHLLENAYESYEPNHFDNHEIDDPNESKEATLQQIRMLEQQQALRESQNQKPLLNDHSDEQKDHITTHFDVPIENITATYESPSCDSADVFPHVTEQKEDQFTQFSALIANEMSILKSPKVIRRLKMDILKLVYDAQSEEEKIE